MTLAAGAARPGSTRVAYHTGPRCLCESERERVNEASLPRRVVRRFEKSSTE